MVGIQWWVVVFLADISLKAALLAVTVWAGLKVCRVHGASLQHRVWLLVLMGMLVLPGLVNLVPGISLPHWLYPNLHATAKTQSEPPSQAPSAEAGNFQIGPGTPSPSIVMSTDEIPATSTPSPLEADVRHADDAVPPTVTEERTASIAATVPAVRPRTLPANTLALALLVIYLLGVAVQSARLLIGILWTARLARRAQPIETILAGDRFPHWARLAESARVRVPVTVGYWRPVVLLPADWKQWSDTFLAMVLAHETEHVRRRDTWVALLAAVNCAVYWFHPAAWFVRRRLTDLAERICDDEVIRITGNRGDYAQNLLAMAGRMTSDAGRLQPVGVAMARKANVVQRIEAIIDRDRPLSQRIGTLGALLLLGVVVPLTLLAAGLKAADSLVASEAESAIEEEPGNTTQQSPSLHVTVVSKTGGKPIPAAVVSLGYPPDRDHVDYHCDKNGEALIEAATRKPCALWTKADGFALQESVVRLPGTDTTHVTIALEVGTELFGTVRDPDGKAVPGVSVGVLRPGSWCLIPIAETDTDGRYRLENVPLIEVSLYWGGNEFTRGFLKVRPSEQAEYDLTVMRRPYGGAVRGTVIDTEGSPVSGAVVESRGVGSTADIRCVETREDGTFLFDDVYSEGTHPLRLVVKAKGFAPRLIPFSPGTREEPTELEITLRPGHSIRGKVVDANGAPIADARVLVIPTGFERYYLSRTDAKPTDAEGRFEWDSLPADVHVEIFKNGYSGIDERCYPDMRSQPLFTMLPAGAICGRVVDDTTSRPVPSFTAQLSNSPRPVLFAQPDGAFAFDNLDRGSRLQLIVNADGYDRKVLPWFVVPGGDTPPMEVRLVPVDSSKLLTIAGRIVNEQSQPMAGMQLRLIVTSKPVSPDERQELTWGIIRWQEYELPDFVLHFLETTSDDDGRFRFEGVDSHRKIELAYWGSGISAARVGHLEEMSPEELGNLVIRSQTAGNIRLRLDRAKHPEVEWLGLDGLPAASFGPVSVQSDSFEIRDVPPGKYRLQVQGAHWEKKRERDILKRLWTEVEPGKTVAIDYDGEAKTDSLLPEADG